MEYDIVSVARIIGAPSDGLGPGRISHLLTDSRRLSYPESTLFFALETAANDGHRYIGELYRLRVRYFVVRYLPDNADRDLPEAVFLRVPDPLAALQQLAAAHRSRFTLPVVAITGSNGKTVTKEFLYQLLREDDNIVRSPRSYNSQTGVPLSVWETGPQHTLALFEAGISRPGEMERLERILRPDWGVFTGIGEAHQENFTGLEEKCREKLRLFRNAEGWVFNGDDPLVRRVAESENLMERARWWSRTDSRAPVYFPAVRIGEEETRIHYRTGNAEGEIRIPFTDEASIQDVLHAVALISVLRPQALLPERFARLEPVAMRLEVKQGRNNCLLINDTYNSDFNSLSIALDFQLSRRKARNYRTTLILSDLLQSGQSAGQLYERIAELLRHKPVERLIGIGPEISANAGRFTLPCSFYPDTDAFLRSAEFTGLQDELILLKGSRDFHFERLTERLEKKVHETILEVNLDAIVHNFNQYRARLAPRTKIVCMVKAFGYGAGSYELAKTLQDHRCDYLAVAVADEGVELRKEGITVPIIVMNPEFSSFNALFEYRLEPEVYSFRLLDALEREGAARGIAGYPVHLKVDTGMHRLGFAPEEMESVARRLQAGNVLAASSVFSHLAGSDSPEFDDFTHLQFERFGAAVRALESGLGHPVLKHILNSAGIERFPEKQYDMVRLGIGLYGVSASGQPGLRNVSTLKTTILQIRDIPAGDTVGYSRRTRLERDSRIAVIPIGYADGLDRHLSNRAGHVLVHGRRCPIVGNICMDACMIDVTGTEAREGDTVILFGDELPVSELSETLGTIPYEILTSVSPRVKRIYYRE